MAVNVNVTARTADAMQQFRHSNRIVLRDDGKNFLAWKSIVPVYLQSAEYAWEVIEGDIDPIKNPSDRDKYIKGNQNAREIIFSTIEPKTVLRLFFEDSVFVTGKDAWDRINIKYVGSSAIFADIAVAKFTTFKFSPSLSITDNLAEFQTIIYELQETKAGITAAGFSSRLVNCLPNSWDSFKSSWGTRDEDKKHLDTLIEMIIAEDARRRVTNPQGSNNSTALAARVRGRGGHFHRNRTDTRRQQSYRRTTEVVCWNCQKRGHKAFECRSGRRNQRRTNRRPANEQPSARIAEAYAANHHPAQSEGFEVKDETTFLIDSGASCHITNDRSLFTEYVPLEQSREVTLGDSSTVRALGRGVIEITVRRGHRNVNLRLEETLHVPKMTCNLISLGQLLDKGFRCTVRSEGMLLSRGRTKLFAERQSALYKFNASARVPVTSLAATSVTEVSPISLKQAHRTLAHVNKEKVRQVLLRTGIPFVDDMTDCTSCMQGKQFKASYRTKPSSARASSIGVIHGDLCSPTPPSMGGAAHFLTLTDEYSKFRRVFFIRTKDQTAGCIRDYIAWFRNQTGKNITRLHTDQGLEFLNQEVAEMLKEIGAEHTTSNSRTPQQNGISERTNRTLVDLARTLIIDNNLNKSLWAEAIGYCTQILNAITINKFENKSAYEIIYKKRPYLGKIHPFGSECYVLDQRPNRKKFDPKSLKGVLVGLNDGVLGYRVLIPGTTSVRVSNNVVFPRKSPLSHPSVPKPSDGGDPQQGPSTSSQVHDGEVDSMDEEESAPDVPAEPNQDNDEGMTDQRPTTPENFSSDSQQPQPTEEEQPPIGGSQRQPEQQRTNRQLQPRQQQSQITSQRQSEQPRDSSSEQPSESVEQQGSGVDDQQPGTSGQSGHVSHTQKKKRRGKGARVPQQESTRVLRDRSKIKKPDRYMAGVAASQSCDEQSDTPQTYEQAMNSPSRNEWLSAMRDELKSMETLNVWTLTELPPGKRSLGCRWVFKQKKDSSGKVERHRARLVLKGFLQKQGIDFKELYSPTAKYETVRAVLNIAAKEKLIAFQFDVTTAFLYAELDNQTLFMDQPPGFEDGSRRVCKLNKSIYGLRQSNRMFHLKIKSILLDLKLVQSSADYCVFYSKGDDRILVCLYVDDAICLGRNEKVINEFMEKLKQKLEIKYKPLEYFLGLQIRRTSDMGVIIHQQQYIKELLEKFQMQNCKPVSTPIERTVYGEDKTDPIDDSKYRELIGSIMYVAQGTRPDIAFAVSFLSRFLHCPTKNLWGCAKRLLQYLNATRNYGIYYDSNASGTYNYFVDSDYASCPQTRKSTSGMIIVANNGPIFWQSQKQSSVALSTCEA